MKVSDKIKLFRKAYHLNQSDLAELTNSGRSALANYETGRSTPPLFFVQFMSRKSGLPIEVFTNDMVDLHINDKMDGLTFENKTAVQNDYTSQVTEPDAVYNTSNEVILLKQIDLLKAQIEVLKQVIIELKKA
jgi:transcriptional regulator with XRE-family HTH domain